MYFFNILQFFLNIWTLSLSLGSIYDVTDLGEGIKDFVTTLLAKIVWRQLWTSPLNFLNNQNTDK